jgi:hypothetical protein
MRLHQAYESDSSHQHQTSSTRKNSWQARPAQGHDKCTQRQKILNRDDLTRLGRGVGCHVADVGDYRRVRVTTVTSHQKGVEEIVHQHEHHGHEDARLSSNRTCRRLNIYSFTCCIFESLHLIYHFFSRFTVSVSLLGYICFLKLSCMCLHLCFILIFFFICSFTIFFTVSKVPSQS